MEQWCVFGDDHKFWKKDGHELLKYEKDTNLSSFACLFVVVLFVCLFIGCVLKVLLRE